MSESGLQATEKTRAAYLPMSSKVTQQVFLAIGKLHGNKVCDTLQGIARTNVKTVNQTFLLHIESSLDRLGLLSPTHGQRSQQQREPMTLQSFSIIKFTFLKATSCRNKEKGNEVHGDGGLELVKQARESASSRPSPVHP